MNLEAELDQVIQNAGWAGISWSALSAAYAKVANDDLKRALDHLIAKKSIYRFLRPHGIGRTSAKSTLYYSYWPATPARPQAPQHLTNTSELHA